MDLKKITIFICGIWLAIVAIWIMQAEITLKTGREVLLKTVPVDPRDMLMGDYVILNYEISQVPIDNSQNFTCDINKVLYVILKTNSNNIASIKEVSYELPKGELFLKGKIKSCSLSNKRIKYGIESYYVKEGSGRKLEKDLREGALVKVSISKNGNAKIKEILK